MIKKNYFYSTFLLCVIFQFSIVYCQVNKDLKSDSIPIDVKYEIINSDVMPGIKRTLNIRLNKKVSKDVLSKIAFKLKETDSHQYQNIYILYYLPDMKVGAGAWATTHFEPDLKVAILGISIEDEKKLISNSDKISSRKIMGNWLDESPGLSSKMMIYFENGKYYLKTTYTDGSGGVQQILKKPSSEGNKFVRMKLSKAGDHYLIDNKGNLQVRDNDGLIFIARKIN